MPWIGLELELEPGQENPPGIRKGREIEINYNEQKFVRTKLK